MPQTPDGRDLVDQDSLIMQMASSLFHCQNLTEVPLSGSGDFTFREGVTACGVRLLLINPVGIVTPDNLQRLCCEELEYVKNYPYVPVLSHLILETNILPNRETLTSAMELFQHHNFYQAITVPNHISNRIIGAYTGLFLRMVNRGKLGIFPTIEESFNWLAITNNQIQNG